MHLKRPQVANDVCPFLCYARSPGRTNPRTYEPTEGRTDNDDKKYNVDDKESAVDRSNDCRSWGVVVEYNFDT